MVEQQDVMSLKDLAVYLQMSEASLYHLVAEGKIPGVKVGKRWRFNKKTVDAWLNGRSRAERSILVVDDDPMVLESVSQAIKSVGLNCVGACSAEDAVALVREIAFDAILLDVILSDGSALDVVKAIDRDRSKPDVALVTAFPDSPIVDEIRSLMPKIEVFAKPVRLGSIIQFARGS